MKRLLLICTLIFCILTFFGCSIKLDIPESQSDEATEVIATAKDEEISTTRLSKIRIDYDGKDIFDLWYMNDNASNDEQDILELTYFQYGTAGASLKEAQRTLLFLRISQDDKAPEIISGLLKEMNPVQRDFFSYAWDFHYKNSKELFKDSASYKKFMDENFDMDFNIEDYSEEKSDKVNIDVQKIFEENLIDKSWQRYETFEDILY